MPTGTTGRMAQIAGPEPVLSRREDRHWNAAEPWAEWLVCFRSAAEGHSRALREEVRFSHGKPREHGSAGDRHHPDAGGRRRAEGEVGTSRHADGRGARGIYAVAAGAALRPGGPRLDQ